MQYLGEILALIFICLACYTDLKHFKIPNKLSLLPYITGICLYMIKLDFMGLVKASLGGLLIFIVLFLLYLTKGLGAGDVKFITGLAFLLDYNQLWNIIIYSFLIAGIIAIFIYFFKFVLGLLQNTSKVRERKNLRLHKIISIPTTSIIKMNQIPFMVAVLPAYVFDSYIEVLL